MELGQIRENLMVHAKGEGSMNGAQGEHIGTVDHLEGERFIKLNRQDSIDGQHHWIPVDWVENIDDQAVYLKMSKKECVEQWLSQNPNLQ